MPQRKKPLKHAFNKMKVAYHLTKDTYNKKAISINAKLRHYSTVICLEALNAAECLTLNKRMMMKQLEERKILRKNLGINKRL